MSTEVARTGGCPISRLVEIDSLLTAGQLASENKNLRIRDCIWLVLNAHDTRRFIERSADFKGYGRSQDVHQKVYPRQPNPLRHVHTDKHHRCNKRKLKPAVLDSITMASSCPAFLGLNRSGPVGANPLSGTF